MVVMMIFTMAITMVMKMDMKMALGGIIETTDIETDIIALGMFMTLTMLTVFTTHFFTAMAEAIDITDGINRMST